MMAKKESDERLTVRFTVKSTTGESLSGMIQTEDQDEREQRVLLDDSGVAEVNLPAGQYTFVWAVKMTPIQRHRYSMKAERIPDDGDPVELRKRPSEQTTTKGEDVGFDDFTL
jgi:hypothetical protein